MPAFGPLEQFLDLNRFSSEFPGRLAEILLIEECMNEAQALRGEELTNFVEGLDHVRAQSTPANSPLNAIIGPQRSRPHRRRLSSLSFRTPEGLRRLPGLTRITYTLGE